jgi:hypothetical protein
MQNLWSRVRSSRRRVGQATPSTEEAEIVDQATGTGLPRRARALGQRPDQGDVRAVSALVRDKLKLAELEMTRKDKQAGIGVGILGGSGQERPGCKGNLAGAPIGTAQREDRYRRN